MVVAEALDRVSRDQEHLAHFYKHLTFKEVHLFTLSEGWISEIHIGLGGTMGALYVRQLAEKTHRGLRGRIEAGKSGGGLTYGYDVVRIPKPDGTFDDGERRINEAEAAIVRRIFEATPRHATAKDRVDAERRENPGPRGKGWGASTINGNSERGVGILNNPLYVGKLVWNKLRYVKDPDTGKRLSRVNDGTAVSREGRTGLAHCQRRAVGARQGPPEAVSFTSPAWRRSRGIGVGRDTLLSGLAKCGFCGGGFRHHQSDPHGLRDGAQQGDVREPSLAVARERLETTVLERLKTT